MRIFFEFNAGTGLAFRMEDAVEDQGLAARLAEVHHDFLSARRCSQDAAGRYYDKAVEGLSTWLAIMWCYLIPQD